MHKALVVLRQADALLQGYDFLLTELSKARIQWEIERASDSDVVVGGDRDMANQATKALIRNTKEQLDRLEKNICAAADCRSLDDLRFKVEELGGLVALINEQIKIVYKNKAALRYKEAAGVTVTEEEKQTLRVAEVILEGAMRDAETFLETFEILLPSNLTLA